jgi:hypothetical protein
LGDHTQFSPLLIETETMVQIFKNGMQEMSKYEARSK